jgi:hypothetical protein
MGNVDYWPALEELKSLLQHKTTRYISIWHIHTQSHLYWRCLVTALKLYILFPLCSRNVLGLKYQLLTTTVAGQVVVLRTIYKYSRCHNIVAFIACVGNLAKQISLCTRWISSTVWYWVILVLSSYAQNKTYQFSNDDVTMHFITWRRSLGDRHKNGAYHEWCSNTEGNFS